MSPSLLTSHWSRGTEIKILNSAHAAREALIHCVFLSFWYMVTNSVFFKKAWMEGKKEEAIIIIIISLAIEKLPR